MSREAGRAGERAESGVRGWATAEDRVDGAASEASLLSGVVRPSADGLGRWRRDTSGTTGRTRGRAGTGLTAPRKVASWELAGAMMTEWMLDGGCKKLRDGQRSSKSNPRKTNSPGARCALMGGDGDGGGGGGGGEEEEVEEDLKSQTSRVWGAEADEEAHGVDPLIDPFKLWLAEKKKPSLCVHGIPTVLYVFDYYLPCIVCGTATMSD
jgi:hypothetical protein